MNVKYLKQYPEFQKFHQPSPKKSDPQPVVIITDKTPEEALEEAHLNLRNQLADELIQQIMANDFEFFEKLVVRLIVKLGYGGSMRDVGQAVGKSGDEGIDGIIKEDKLGLDIIYIQAKRWEASVGRPEIQKFVGALHGQQAKKGIFITTSSFTSGARDYASKIDTNVVLIDGEQLVDLMIDYNLGVSTVETYEVKKVDTDFFIDD
ncbi:MAG: restriction endonuclease [Proteobacteria bacterium]|nr:restriction endonuclease [Pseudomonadota bacterium]MBU1737787.1 restriction endonuclease [Pseudomonadota bacterium]